MNYRCLISFLIIFSLSLFIFGNQTAYSAPNLQNAFPNAKSTAKTASYATQDQDGSLLVNNLNTIINIALSLLGIIFILLTIYGGVLYMTSRGNEEQTKKGQKIITQALIGLIIILAAYAITYFIFKFFI